jgi:cyclopropane-fatty-acyl-phospholipid synthase
MTVLDIGCGWGSFMKYAAEKYGVSCVGLSVSKEQTQLGEKSCQGLPVKFLLQDYRLFKGEQFDRVVSIGMFEHVGYKNHSIFMQKANSSLKDDGLFLLHTTGGNTHQYGDPWFDKYIFPNAILPSGVEISQAIENLFVLEDWHSFGQYYDPTFMAYYEKFNQNWEILQPKYGDRFYRIWKYFLLSCAGGFRSRNLQVWQIVMSKNGVIGVYDSIR